ncbi:sulfotransferase 1C4-like isoform X2 [Ptychodera flava]|uniref:sulfotransferase 1C4-like isoform X2 n=1 Tax=Ptychodera flava TaxID=63121 RepID=UPI00396A6562
MADYFKLNAEYYKVPGHFTFKDVYLAQYVRKDTLERPELYEIKSDDIFVVSYPKSGTTWTLELAQLIMNKGDPTYSLSENHFYRIPFIEFHSETYPRLTGLTAMQNIESPRLLKSHLPIHLFPPQVLQKGCKIIVVSRNPKDTVASYYNFYQAYPSLLGDYKGDFSNYLKLFMNGKVVYGDWFDHTLGWYEYVVENNGLFLKYEDMKKSPRDVSRKIAEYLNCDLSDEVIDEIVERCSFARMKMSGLINIQEVEGRPFLRKGAVGDWKNYFTLAENEAFDEVYNERMKDSGLSFEWE